MPVYLNNTASVTQTTSSAVKPVLLAALSVSPPTLTFGPEVPDPLTSSSSPGILTDDVLSSGTPTLPVG